MMYRILPPQAVVMNRDGTMHVASLTSVRRRRRQKSKVFDVSRVLGRPKNYQTLYLGSLEIGAQGKVL